MTKHDPDTFNTDRALIIADQVSMVAFIILFIFETYVVVNHVIPLKITSPYILIFYSMLTIMLVSGIVERAARLMYEDPGFLVEDQS